MAIMSADGNNLKVLPCRHLNNHLEIIVVFLLICVVVALYWPVSFYDFIAFDDNLYLLENQNVQQGITWKNLIWAMTTFDATNWHPLTWLSLLVDYELFGLNAAGYHITNLLLHILNTVVLFLLLRRMTADIWKGAFIAALFAVHPLNIESVVWIAERKNLLSTFFWILTIMAYVCYVEKPGWRNYSLTMFFFILGLAAKPMLVTLPLVLLVIDYWPLQRFSLSDLNPSGFAQKNGERQKLLVRLLLEKVPLLLLALLSALVTFHAARAGGAVKTISAFPLIGRIENTIISYAMYLYKMAWPADLAIFYPYPVGRTLWHVGISILLLFAVTVFVYIKGRTYRYLITGWLWYGITLLPVIGLVQVGYQAMANRYAYIPLIGIFIIVCWGLPDVLKQCSVRQYLPAAAIVVILLLTFSTKAALPDWKDSAAVFEYALNVTSNNHIAEMGMGSVWLGRGDLPKAQSYYQAALRIKPDYAEAHNNLAAVLIMEGRADEAAAQCQAALKDKPNYANAYNNLGVAFAIQGKARDAVASFRKALELSPGYVKAQSNLAKLLKAEELGKSAPQKALGRRAD